MTLENGEAQDGQAPAVPEWRVLTRREKAMNADEVLAAVEPILDAIERNTREAVALSAINRPASFDKNVIDRFANTYAAHVFKMVRSQTTLSIVLALARCWDTTGGAKSIPHLVRHLGRRDIVDAIVERRRAGRLAMKQGGIIVDREENREELTAWVERMAEAEAGKAEAQTRAIAADVLDRVDAFMASGLRASLEALRSRSIAHTLEITRAEERAAAAGVPIDPLKIGDEEEALTITMALVTDLNMLYRSLHLGFEDLMKVWDTYAADFWTRINAEPKGRPLPPRG